MCIKLIKLKKQQKLSHKFISLDSLKKNLGTIRVLRLTIHFMKVIQLYLKCRSVTKVHSAIRRKKKQADIL